MRNERLPLYRDLEQRRGSRVLAYITGDRPGLETQIHPEVLDYFVHHLDIIGVTKRITLYLYTRGGSTLASWSIVNLLRQFCDELEVVVPAKAQSGGTLICLGADKIVMTKQATLGPIDPSVNGPLNPLVGGVVGAPAQARVPVSVEDINGFVEFARANLGDESGMTAALSQLSGQVHPLVLGNAYRSRVQIRMLAKRLVSRQITDGEMVQKVLDFLCSDSGSHDYTIFRREARNELGLKIEKPDDDGYRLIKAIYEDIARELELTAPYNPNVVLGQQQSVDYCFRRGLIESVTGGCHVHLSEGTLRQHQIQISAPGLPPGLPGLTQVAIQDNRTFEGWRYEQ